MVQKQKDQTVSSLRAEAKSYKLISIPNSRTALVIDALVENI